MKRDALTREQAQSRIDAQMPSTKSESTRKWVIDNSGTLDDGARRFRRCGKKSPRERRAHLLRHWLPRLHRQAPGAAHC